MLGWDANHYFWQYCVTACRTDALGRGICELHTVGLRICVLNKTCRYVSEAIPTLKRTQEWNGVSQELDIFRGCWCSLKLHSFSCQQIIHFTA